MPKVKLTKQSTADLSAAYQPLEEAALVTGARNTLAFTRQNLAYEKEGQRLSLIEQQYNKDYETSLDQIMESEKAKGGSFDANTKDQLRSMARDISNAKAMAAVGTGAAYEYGDLEMPHDKAYDVIAKNNRTLDAMTNNMGPLNALNQKIIASNGLKQGDIGKLIHDGSGNTADLVDIVQSVMANDGSVKYEVDDMGAPYYVKNGIKVPIEAINKIMTGENAEYPLQFNEDPTQSLKLISDAIPDDVFSKTYTDKSQAIADGGKYIVTKEGKYKIVDEDKYKDAFRGKMNAMLNDPKQMQTYWNVIGGEGYYKPDEITKIDTDGDGVADKDMTMEKAAKYLGADFAADQFIVGGTRTIASGKAKMINTNQGGPKKPPTKPVDAKEFQKLQFKANSFYSKTESPNSFARYLNTLPGNRKFFSANEIEQKIDNGMLSDEKGAWKNAYTTGSGQYKNVGGIDYGRAIFEVMDDGSIKMFLEDTDNKDAVLSAAYEARGYDEAGLDKLKPYGITNVRVRHQMMRKKIGQDQSGQAIYADAEQGDPNAQVVTIYSNLPPGGKQRVDDFMKKWNNGAKFDPNRIKLANGQEALEKYNKDAGKSGKLYYDKPSLPGTK